MANISKPVLTQIENTPRCIGETKVRDFDRELLKACFSREWLLMKRNSFAHVFKSSQITIVSIIALTVVCRTEMPVGTVQDGSKYFGALFFSVCNVMFNGMAEMTTTVSKLPVFSKQRDFLFYPAWAFGLPTCVLIIPLSLLESGISIVLKDYTIGFAQAVGRFFKQFLAFFGLHQMALSLFRLMVGVGRTTVLANMLDDIEPWMAYYVSPMMYGQNAIFINEFLDKRWNTEMKRHGVKEDKLQLLRDVSGVFRPGNLTALIGVTGAGKTTFLMSWQEERPAVTLKEALASQAIQRTKQHSLGLVATANRMTYIHHTSLSMNPCSIQRGFIFVEEVMELVELNPIRNALVGLPGVDGLSTEQRKRLTIAVELVANPSIIFMDEPTSGLDARAAAIVMHAYRGQVIYAGPLGHHSYKLIEYFEEIPGIPKIKDGYNPATWMLEEESGVYLKSLVLRHRGPRTSSFLPNTLNHSLSNTKLVSGNNIGPTGETLGTTPFDRFFMTIVIGALLGLIFWNKGQHINASAVQPIVDVERTVFYCERAAGFYSALPCAFAHVAIEIIYTAIQSFVYAILLYSAIGLERNTGKFLWFYYYIFMCLVYFTLYGMMAAALTPGHQIAAIFLYFFCSFWVLFSGFPIPRAQLPIWRRGYYFASPVSWTLHGLVSSQVGDPEISGLGFSIPLKEFLKDNLGFHHDSLWGHFNGPCCLGSAV
ncbi:hypothetical protein TIFTF001_008611 [Ficus carica]|uniref:ABC transporter domain-containing protein n=1 Tax=Ficus carica TaxID=3494 RepID=A0AA87ZNB4_FICCA|nr:hypothetical protein TIFTF001_008611 [Ficus carica]